MANGTAPVHGFASPHTANTWRDLKKHVLGIAADEKHEMAVLRPTAKRG